MSVSNLLARSYSNTSFTCLIFFVQCLKSSPSCIENKDEDYSVPSWSLLNPLSPYIHIQILQTDLHTSPLRISWENLIKDHGIFSMVIILLILITLSLDSVWILLRENWCWSLLALEGLKEFLRGWQRPRHRSAKKLSTHVGGTKPRRRVQGVTRNTSGFLSLCSPNLVTAY